MATTERDSEAVEAWIVANARAVSGALRAAEDELYGLLGGERDRDREREALGRVSKVIATR
jgi:hypothetical protein